MQIDGQDAAAALATMRESKRRFESSLTCGPGYSVAFGVLTGWLVGIQGLPLIWKGAGYVVGIAAIAAMVRYQRRTTGRFVNGYRAGRTRWVAASLAVTIGLLIFLAAWLSLRQGIAWAAPALGVVGAVVGFFGNAMWMRAYRADIAEERL